MLAISVLLFGVAALLDVFWALYTIHVAALHPARSALWAAMIYLPMGFTVPTLAHHPFDVLPLAAGAAAGTGITVWRRKHHASD